MHDPGECKIVCPLSAPVHAAAGLDHETSDLPALYSQKRETILGGEVEGVWITLRAWSPEAVTVTVARFCPCSTSTSTSTSTSLSKGAAPLVQDLVEADTGAAEDPVGTGTGTVIGRCRRGPDPGSSQTRVNDGLSALRLVRDVGHTRIFRRRRPSLIHAPRTGRIAVIALGLGRC